VAGAGANGTSGNGGGDGGLGGGGGGGAFAAGGFASGGTASPARGSLDGASGVSLERAMDRLVEQSQLDPRERRRPA
jgi:hypothetical protein